MRLFRSIIKFFKLLFSSYRKQTDSKSTRNPIHYIAVQVDDLPDNEEINDKTIYLVGEYGFLWLAAFKCPCDCGDLIQLNLLPEAYPHWRISYISGGIVSISPSIDRKVGCLVHFMVKKGKIEWWKR